MEDWKTYAIELIQETVEIARANKSKKLAEASSQVLNAMAADGLVDPDNANHYAMIMDELIATGALRLQSTVECRTVAIPSLKHDRKM